MRIQPYRKTSRDASALRPNTHVSVLEIVNALIAASHLREVLPKIKSFDDCVVLLENLSTLAQKYRDESDAPNYLEVVQLEAVLKKFPFKASNLDPRGKGKEKFLSAEAQCRETNARLRMIRSPLIQRMSEIIFSLIGEFEPSMLPEIEELGSFGPGATLTHSRGKVTSIYKYIGATHSCTSTCKPYAMYAISRNPRWMDHLYKTVELKSIPPLGYTSLQKELIYLDHALDVQDVERVSFVPKTYSVERPIGVGASMNSYWQLGINRYFEAKLKNIGIDLSDQTKNQRLARAGSQYFNSSTCFCTIDLASASDTISYELVKQCLPRSWFLFLSEFRSRSGILDGEEILYEKFSAMGNGYTFSLETMIFWAAVKAAHEIGSHSFQNRDFAIYGDDIIVRKGAFSATCAALEECGFRLNVDKTFCDGSFRESCGADFIKGINVRPVYLRKPLLKIFDLYHFYNRLSARHRDDILNHFVDALWQLYQSKKVPIAYCPPNDYYSGYATAWKEIPGPNRSAIVKRVGDNVSFGYTRIGFKASLFKENQRALAWCSLLGVNRNRFSPWMDYVSGRKDKITRREIGMWSERRIITPIWDSYSHINGQFGLIALTDS